MKFKKAMLLTMVLGASLVSCGEADASSPSTGNDSSDSSSRNPSESVRILDPIGGAAVEAMYRGARAYLESSSPASALKAAKVASGDGTNGVELRWEFEDAQPKSGYCTVEIATDEAFQNIVKTGKNIRKSAGAYTVYNLLPDTTYYYRVRSDKAVSSVDSFVLKGPVRTIKTGDKVRNMRDLGGWKADGSRSVKYGLLYRSAAWNGADTISDAYFKDLGIKTELDVRYGYKSTEHPIDGVAFYNFGLYQYDAIVPGSKKYTPTEGSIKSIFELLAKESSYPLVFHCTSGADRTGTLAYLINGLLGVSYEDLCKDFELTSFYLDARYRSAIVDNAFDDTGVMMDNENNYVAFGALHNAILSKYGKEGESLSYAIENYLESACNVSQATIDGVKDILLGE